jgi:nicotinate-nucleotide pyrophosphorylase (carboxylating)
MNHEWWMGYASQLNEQYKIATLTACQNGVVACMEEAVKMADGLDLQVDVKVQDGECIAAGQVALQLSGKITNLILAERILPGILSKPSGIATAARQAAELAQGKIRIVVGALKKIAPESREFIFQALKTGGVSTRLADGPMVYLDKNMIRAFGGLQHALEAGAAFPDRSMVVQLRGLDGSILNEARLAMQFGAEVLMVDTGNKEDVYALLDALTEAERASVRIAFSGEVQLREIPEFTELKIDALCIGKAVLDAPMLDFKLDIASEN